jgi:hypothetical protein
LFFIIIALACLAAIIILLFITRVHGIFRLENKRLLFHVDWLFIRLMKREYRIGRDEEKVLSLYRIMKTREQKVTTLTEVLFEEKPDRNASLFSLIKLAIKSRHERNRVSPWLIVLEISNVDLRLGTEVGTGDAFLTAMTCGLLTTVGNAICAANSTKREHYRVFVQPEFEHRSFSLYGDCIITATPANIIRGYFIYKIRARGKKNASNRKHHADSNGQDQGNGGR